MDNLRLLRSIAFLENRVKQLESGNTGSNPELANVASVNLDEVVSRLAAVEARPVVNLDEVVGRLSAVEARPVVNLDEVFNRLSAVEARPDVTQRLSALELTIASLNNS